MRNGKKALLMLTATVLTMVSLAILNFVRVKMEANDRLNTAATEYSAPETTHVQ